MVATASAGHAGHPACVGACRQAGRERSPASRCDSPQRLCSRAARSSARACLAPRGSRLRSSSLYAPGPLSLSSSTRRATPGRLGWAHERRDEHPFDASAHAARHRCSHSSLRPPCLAPLPLRPVPFVCSSPRPSGSFFAHCPAAFYTTLALRPPSPRRGETRVPLPTNTRLRDRCALHDSSALFLVYVVSTSPAQCPSPSLCTCGTRVPRPRNLPPETVARRTNRALTLSTTSTISTTSTTSTTSTPLVDRCLGTYHLASPLDTSGPRLPSLRSAPQYAPPQPHAHCLLLHTDRLIALPGCHILPATVPASNVACVYIVVEWRRNLLFR
jgi:hypothetical protein